ncbi:putative nudix hydrolase 3 [Sesbania bispinosa]|nr:putative nudix hydrolase 3 [Sesbania bispinosa]
MGQGGEVQVECGVHVLIFAESTQQLLLQRPAHSPALWDITIAAHISDGHSSLATAR